MSNQKEYINKQGLRYMPKPKENGKAWLPHQIQKNNMEQHNNNTMEEDNLGILDQGVACLDLLPILESHEHLGLPRLFSLFKAFVQPRLAWLV
jgi:hypothetical protein